MNTNVCGCTETCNTLLRNNLFILFLVICCNNSKMIPYICDINNKEMTTRICDNCRFLYSNMEQTREWCSKKSEGTRFTREYTKEYIELRLNAEVKNCKGYDK